METFNHNGPERYGSSKRTIWYIFVQCLPLLRQYPYEYSFKACLFTRVLTLNFQCVWPGLPCLLVYFNRRTVHEQQLSISLPLSAVWPGLWREVRVAKHLAMRQRDNTTCMSIALQNSCHRSMVVEIIKAINGRHACKLCTLYVHLSLLYSTSARCLKG